MNIASGLLCITNLYDLGNGTVTNARVSQSISVVRSQWKYELINMLHDV